MFKRVLLCYDGTEVGRRALKRGAELAILIGARVHVLSIVPGGFADPTVAAAAAGSACLVDGTSAYRKLLDESVEWLKARPAAHRRRRTRSSSRARPGKFDTGCPTRSRPRAGGSAQAR